MPALIGILIVLAATTVAPARPPPFVVPRRAVVLFGEIDADTAAVVAVRAAEAAELCSVAPFARCDDLVLLIHSPGGTMASSLLMGASLRAARDAGVRVVCVVPFKAHSAAFTVLQHCDERLVGPDVRLSQHRPTGPLSRSRTAWLTNRATCRAEALRMGVPLDGWTGRVAATVVFEDGDGAVARGAADRVVRPVCHPAVEHARCRLALIQLAHLVDRLGGGGQVGGRPAPLLFLPPPPGRA